MPRGALFSTGAGGRPRPLETLRRAGLLASPATSQAAAFQAAPEITKPKEFLSRPAKLGEREVPRRWRKGIADQQIHHLYRM